MAEPLQRIISNRYGGRNLPVTLVLPDGGRVPLSSNAEIEVLARTWRGLKALAAPAMGALARHQTPVGLEERCRPRVRGRK